MDKQNTIHKIISRHPGKKLVIFGAGNGGLYIFYHALERGLEAEYFVDNLKSGTEFCRKEVRSPYDLMYEDPENLLVITGINQQSSITSAVQQLEGMGFIQGKNFEIPEFGQLYAPANYLDPLLAYSRMDDLPGFKVTRSPGKNPLKIVCLGGSTSDWSFGCFTCWAEFYRQYMEDAGISVDLYNGAISGYHSALELLKLIRDVIPMKPDCVLLLNGVNDGNQSPVAGHPMHHVYTGKVFDKLKGQADNSDLEINSALEGVLYGPEDHTSPAEVYFRNMRMMDSLCREFSIAFFPVLQPTGIFPGKNDLQLPLYDFYEKVTADIGKYPFITDGTLWLDNQLPLYFDYIHYNENGNRILAEKFFALSHPVIRELKK